MIHFIENTDDVVHWARNFGDAPCQHYLDKLASPYREVKNWLKTTDIHYAIVLCKSAHALYTFGHHDTNLVTQWLNAKPELIVSKLLLPFNECQSLIADNPHWIVGFKFTNIEFADKKHFMEACLLGMVGS